MAFSYFDLYRTDNTGPPTEIQEVLSYYEILRAEFPGAALVASTLDAFVAKVEPLKHTLPVSDLEMGDTWIQVHKLFKMLCCANRTCRQQ